MSTGLNTDFALQSGSFVLSSDASKSYNELWFLMNFDTDRIYLEDFPPGLESLVAKPASWLLQNQTLVLGGLVKLITKYVDSIKIISSSLLYGLADRKQYFISIDHQYTPGGPVNTAITFIGG